MARDHALGAWGETSPAVMGSTENCDPLSSTSAPSRGSEKPELPPQPTCSHCYKRSRPPSSPPHVAKANHSNTAAVRCGKLRQPRHSAATPDRHSRTKRAPRVSASGCPLCLAIGAPGSSAHARKRVPVEIDPRSRAPGARGARGRARRWTARWWASSRTGEARCARACVWWTNEARRCRTRLSSSAPVTDYRTKLTGVDADNAARVFAGAPPPPRRARWSSRYSTRKKRTIRPTMKPEPPPPPVVGHDLAHDPACLGIDSEAAGRAPQARPARYAPSSATRTSRTSCAC